MARKRKPEGIIGKLREAEIVLAQGGAVADECRRIGVKTLYITPGSPWENGYCEPFNGSMRDELLNGEIFHTFAEAQILIEAWRRHDNTVRQHSSLGYRPPAPLRPQSPMAPEAIMH